MTRLLSLLILLLPMAALAQDNDDDRVRISLAGVYNGPVGNMRQYNGDQLLMGKTVGGGGMSLSVQKPVYHGWSIGLSIGYSDFKLSASEIRNQLLMRYAQPGYYTSYTTGSLRYQLTQLGFDIAKNIPFRGGNITPFFRASVAALDGDPQASIRLKQQNDNYFISYELKPTPGTDDVTNPQNFVLATFGINLDARLTDLFWFHSGVSYTGGAYRMDLNERTTDLYDQDAVTKIGIRQPVTMFNLSLGLQVRFGRR